MLERTSRFVLETLPYLIMASSVVLIAHTFISL